MRKTNIWVLTEERPKKDVLETIFYRYSREKSIACFIDNIRIIPVLENDKFSFVYKVTGYNTPKIESVYLKIVAENTMLIT